MNKSDFEEFNMIWSASVEVTGGKPSDSAITLAFTILQKYDIDTVKKALGAHLSDPRTGKFQPKPADVIEQIQKVLHNDGRPEANEAWAIAIGSFDESSTVILNDDIAAALEFCSRIYSDGDKTGARMAFKESYEKIVARARDERKTLKWWPSLGHDKHGRESVLKDAVVKGLLPASQVNGILPEPITPDGQKLLGTVGKLIGEKPDMKALESAIDAMKESLK